MLKRQRGKNVQAQGWHEKLSILVRNEQNSSSGLCTNILWWDVIFARGSCKRKEGTEDLHWVNVILPDMESFGTKIDGKDAIARFIIEKIETDRLRDIS